MFGNDWGLLANGLLKGDLHAQQHHIHLSRVYTVHDGKSFCDSFLYAELNFNSFITCSNKQFSNYVPVVIGYQKG